MVGPSTDKIQTESADKHFSEESEHIIHTEAICHIRPQPVTPNGYAFHLRGYDRARLRERPDR